MPDMRHGILRSSLRARRCAASSWRTGVRCRGSRRNTGRPVNPRGV